MKTCRVLFFDFEGAGFVDGRPAKLLAPFMSCRPQVFYSPAFLIGNEQRLETLSRIAGKVDPSVIVAEAAHTKTFDTFAFVNVLLRAHSHVQALLIAEEAYAMILRFLNGEIHDTRIVAMNNMESLDIDCMPAQHADDPQMQTLREQIGLAGLVGESERFMTEVRKIAPVAEVDATVLLMGETGTGKEGFARAIHYLSARRGKPFSPVNCGAIPHELLENEFFGHEAGAYTGASSRQAGWIKDCDGGTLFLDEVDTLPLPVQTKLLRFIQEREYKPLGSLHVNKADVRIIAASNTDLELAVREGRFRQDLFYRLNIIPITLPPLRERAEDIPLLARHFLAKYARHFHKQIRDFTPNALAALMAYSWPGNVRQLENTIERIVVFAKGEAGTENDVLLGGIRDKAPESLRSAKSKAVEHCERSYILGALIANNGNVARAARAAKKHPRAFRQLIHKYAIDLEKFRSK